MHIELNAPIVVLILAPQIVKVLIELLRILVGSRTKKR